MVVVWCGVVWCGVVWCGGGWRGLDCRVEGAQQRRRRRLDLELLELHGEPAGTRAEGHGARGWRAGAERRAGHVSRSYLPCLEAAPRCAISHVSWRGLGAA